MRRRNFISITAVFGLGSASGISRSVIGKTEMMPAARFSIEKEDFSGFFNDLDLSQLSRDQEKLLLEIENLISAREYVLIDAKVKMYGSNNYMFSLAKKKNLDERSILFVLNANAENIILLTPEQSRLIVSSIDQVSKSYSEIGSSDAFLEYFMPYEKSSFKNKNWNLSYLNYYGKTISFGIKGRLKV